MVMFPLHVSSARQHLADLHALRLFEVADRRVHNAQVVNFVALNTEQITVIADNCFGGGAWMSLA